MWDKETKKRCMDFLSIPSPSGYEDGLQGVWTEMISAYGVDVRSFTHGTRIAHMNPGGKPRIMFAAHCDEIGMMITYIDESGFIYVGKVGFFNERLLEGNAVVILTDSGPVHGVVGAIDEENLREPLTIDQCWIDIGCDSREETMQYVKPGDYVVLHSEPRQLNGYRISARGVDDKLGVFLMSQIIRNLVGSKITPELYFVSSTCEEIHSGGAKATAYQIMPDIAVVIEMTYTTDYPYTKPERNGYIRMGNGPVLTKSPILNSAIVKQIDHYARGHGLPLQYEIYPTHTLSDADTISTVAQGIPTAIVCCPIRYMHSQVETFDVTDAEALEMLVTNWIRSL